MEASLYFVRVCRALGCNKDQDDSVGAYFHNHWLCDTHAEECKEALSYEGRYLIHGAALKNYFNEIRVGPEGQPNPYDLSRTVAC